MRPATVTGLSVGSDRCSGLHDLPGLTDIWLSGHRHIGAILANVRQVLSAPQGGGSCS